MAAVLKARNQFSANLKNVRFDSPAAIAEYTHERIFKGRGTMILLIRDDGRVRVVRDDVLEDDSGRGVVGYFGKRRTVDEIQAKLEAFLARFPEYLA